MSDTDRLYFRQLLSGRDFAQGDGIAAQMRNFAYLIGDRQTGDCVVVDPAYAAGDLVDVLEADGLHLSGVLVNLLQNAIEALALQKNPREVRITSQERGSRPGLVTIRFEDNGPGVSQEAREHLFEPFFTTKRNGTGLGLATSQRFVAAHGGSIELEDSALGGACLVVSLPLTTPWPSQVAA